MTPEEQIAFRHKTLCPVISERVRRLFAAVEASLIGRGGIATVSAATGVSRTTIVRGLAELETIRGSGIEADTARCRKEGGGRKKVADGDPAIREELDRLVNPTTRGDPMSPLKWTCKSLRNLEKLGHKVSYRMLAQVNINPNGFHGEWNYFITPN